MQMKIFLKKKLFWMCVFALFILLECEVYVVLKMITFPNSLFEIESFLLLFGRIHNHENLIDLSILKCPNPCHQRCFQRYNSFQPD
jgi:uncharacterized membrane protein